MMTAWISEIIGMLPAMKITESVSANRPRKRYYGSPVIRVSDMR
jgi:hypothetical protein